jgi:segregation and condensation protein B
MQPVTKGDIENIRGVSADSVIATLVDRRFLMESGRKDVAGRPILYKTTPEFLETFGLRSLDELPPIDIESGVQVELALPIPTSIVVDHTIVEDDTAVEPDAEDEPAPVGAADIDALPEPAAEAADATGEPALAEGADTELPRSEEEVPEKV